MSDGGEPCDRCGEVRETAAFGQRQLCKSCSGKPVRFAAACQTNGCDWSYAREGRESNRVSIRQNVQMEANNHETEKDVFEEETHETEWWEGEPDGDGEIRIEGPEATSV